MICVSGCFYALNHEETIGVQIQIERKSVVVSICVLLTSYSCVCVCVCVCVCSPLEVNVCLNIRQAVFKRKKMCAAQVSMNGGVPALSGRTWSTVRDVQRSLQCLKSQRASEGP